MRTILLLVFFISVTVSSFAESDDTALERQPVVSGYIRDGSTGETLIGATMQVKGTHRGVASNQYGFYSMMVNSGNNTLVFNYLGYQVIEKEIRIEADLVLNVELFPATAELTEVEVIGNSTRTRLDDPVMGVQKLNSATIKEIPAFMGEVDPIKVIQLMPGVQAASEGSSGFSVRGGNPDQNLVLLDEAIVYNAGHLMGFFSVFNNDAIKEVNLFKGDIPARYGGRLSSLLDVRMKDGNSRRFSGTGGVGTISSRLMLEGPILSEKTTFLAAGRRTYADLFLPFSSDEAVRDNQLFFYDFNAKLNHTFSDTDRLFVSGYFGRDVMDNTVNRIEFGNKTLSVRWNHVYSPRLFSNLSFNFSNYDYLLGASEDDTDGFLWTADMENFNLKADFNYYPVYNHSITFGVQSLFHNIMPGHVRGTGSTTMFNELRLARNRSMEHAVYAENTQRIGDRFTLRYGLRFSLFQNVGKGTSFGFDEDYDVVDTTHYSRGDVFNTYHGFEPRAGFTWMLNHNTSVKGSYSRTYQYLQMASNSTGTMPLDIWFPASPNIKPQMSDQFSAGLFRHIWGGSLDLGAELFYKNMKNAIDFKDYAELLLNELLEGELRFGKAYAYGFELLAQFDYGRWNGWVGYTYSHTRRQINGINDDLWYRSPYDRPHDASVVIMFSPGQRTSLAANWVYLSGSPATFPVGRFESGGSIIPIYSRRNAERLPDYHRMDLSFTLKNRPRPDRRWHGEWVFSVYNAYARKNAWVINFEKADDDAYTTRAMKTYLFSVIPAVTYNFKF
ncbi:TonB-dependent receptor [Natronoflexus pectinivorans]|nr:TonB-dependent receptor [Natronoflexus pectinivorans]